MKAWSYLTLIILGTMLSLILVAGCTATSQVIPPAPTDTSPLASITPLLRTIPDNPDLPAPPANKLGTVERDVEYGLIDGYSLKMDIYYPKSSKTAAPVVIYVHGGGWTSGDKAGMWKEDLTLLLDRGYFVTSINYRLAPQYIFPAQIEDVKQAVRFLRAKAANFGIDPYRFGAWGGSAGGHLVALLGTCGETDFSVGPNASQYSGRIQAVADWFGPADLINMPQASLMTEVFGNKSALEAGSPVTYVSGDDPPFLIMHGDQDKVVPLSQSETLYRRLQAASVPVQLAVVRNAGHSFTPAGAAPISPNLAQIAVMMADFFDKSLK